MNILFFSKQFRNKYLGVFSGLFKTVILYPAPVNLNYFWNFGSLALFTLFVQIISGFLLTFWYIPSVDSAFISVEFIMREINYGWLFRNIHANGASLFFFVVYVHMFRSIYYGSYLWPRHKVWYSGSIIFVLMIATAFFGYVLPFGQMSYWAATVISTLVSVVPFVGDNLLLYLWGGISIEQPTLSRIYTMHFLLPFVILALVLSHLFFLHENGSNNPLGLIHEVDRVAIHPYYTIKDIFGVVFSLLIFLFFVFYIPNYTMHSDNYIIANPDVTPSHIVPEWYFLPFYGILRTVPNKLGGVLLVVIALLLIVFLPNTGGLVVKSGAFRPGFQPTFFLFLLTCILLGYFGGKPMEQPYIFFGQLCVCYYLLYFMVLKNLSIQFERKLQSMYFSAKRHTHD